MTKTTLSTLQSASKLFGLKKLTKLKAPVLSDKDEHVPVVDAAYQFDLATTQAILAGFTHGRKVLLQGYHGTGKSTHIEQVAAQLNWPLVRVNLDGHISRVDLIGRDSIVLKDGKQITEFVAGIIPWAMENGVALLFDEYDAARPDVLFVIQRILESEGKLTLLDQNRVITPHANFRLFATANTVGLGDASGMYHGTNPINQGQMDRWHIVASLNYLPPKLERNIILAKIPAMKEQESLVKDMISMANLTRDGFANGDISTVMSPRTVISWAENYLIFDGDAVKSFHLSFLNKCDEAERPIFGEYYQRIFDIEIL